MNIGIVLAAFFVTIFLGIPIGVSVGLTSLTASWAKDVYKRQPFCPGKGQQIFHSHHDIVFLIGLGRIREHIVIPQILFGRL